MLRTHHNIVLRTVSLLFAIATFVAPLVLSGSVQAAQITERSLTLEGVGSTAAGSITYVGGSTPGGVVNHHFKWKVGENHTLGSIKIEYCATADDLILPTCTVPTGLVTNGGPTNLAANTGDVTGFTLNKTTNGIPYLTRTAAAVTAGDDVDFVIGSVTNPTTANYTFFVRLTSYASIDTTGSSVDAGNVAASTATPIELEGVMPESLIFCTGATIPTANDCSSATPGDIYFDRLFSPLDTATSRSQFAVSTNAGFGYAVTVNGPTLTSGSNFIGTDDDPAVGMAKGPVVLGTAQFGLNLKLNTITDINTDPLGLEKDSVGNPAPVIGAAHTNYATVDEFKYASGDIVATSAGATNWERFTVSYIANVPGAQAAGTYVTTLTYVATPTF